MEVEFSGADVDQLATAARAGCREHAGPRASPWRPLTAQSDSEVLEFVSHLWHEAFLGESMATEAEDDKSDVRDLLSAVDRFLASPASDLAVSDSEHAVDSAIAAMEKAEHIDLETLKLTVTA